MEGDDGVGREALSRIAVGETGAAVLISRRNGSWTREEAGLCLQEGVFRGKG